MGYTLILDTSFKEMVVGVAKDNNLIYKMQKYAFQKQSEIAVQEIDKAFKETNINPKQINKVIATYGPGSYTGVRIALTIAKVFCSSLNIELVPLTSLQALSGAQGKKIALIDARSNLVYYSVIDNGKVLEKANIMKVDELNNLLNKYPSFEVVGDSFLVGQELKEIDIVKNMFELSLKTKGVKEVDNINPLYLK
ncbi:MAG: tRNA (adenosine(37)-N6)-threonylcarbamoyltransferase complex dimerization subunit type 1 TsaB [Erysipelotrichaceae bacterium]|nr:tRNA (adenosine(37)-N6)-threonylcarbamoyltransferase complex dimerization subunit type 1 TsaB [Erysipelotrichaceae bacterium]